MYFLVRKHLNFLRHNEDSCFSSRQFLNGIFNSRLGQDTVALRLHIRLHNTLSMSSALLYSNCD